MRICVADSCRVSAPAYFGKRGVTGFSWYQSQVFNLRCKFWILFRKRDLVLTENLKTSYSYAAIYIYSPLWYWLYLELIVLPLKILIFESSDILDLFSSFELSVFSSCFLPSFSILFLNFVSWDWLFCVEAGGMYQSAQRKRGGFMMCREAMRSLFVFSFDFGILLPSPALFEFRGRNF